MWFLEGERIQGFHTPSSKAPAPAPAGLRGRVAIRIFGPHMPSGENVDFRGLLRKTSGHVADDVYPHRAQASSTKLQLQLQIAVAVADCCC